MVNKNVQTNAIEAVNVLIVDSNNAPLTNKTDIFLKVRRISDNKYLDWTSMSFQTTPTTLNKVLAEVSATLSPGEYQFLFNTALITNPIANDTYQLTVSQVGGSDAINLPQTGELVIGQWIDKINAHSIRITCGN